MISEEDAYKLEIGRDADIVKKHMSKMFGHRLNILMQELIHAPSDVGTLSRIQGAIGEIERVLKSLDVSVEQARRIASDLYKLRSVK